MKQPDLEAWGVFAKVAALGSFAKAAEELSLSNATVSKLISRLEKRLGERLFHRSTRRLSLTETGRVLATRASRILVEAEEAEAEAQLQARAPRGRIKLAAPMSFGLHQISPLLPEFLRAYPEVSVDLQLDDRVVDMIAGSIDVAIRIAALPDSSLVARKLCPVRRFVVGAPSYFEQHGRPKHPHELANHSCLSYSYLPTGDQWQFTNRKGEKESVRIKGPLSANNGDALDDALKSGLGLALQPDFIAWKGLQNGALERVLLDWAAAPLAVNVLTPAGGTRPSRVTALIEFLVRHFAADVVPWAVLK
jgi:DNA-binding transcriptional LysR family regulator